MATVFGVNFGNGDSVVGGTEVGARNVISGNNGHGVMIGISGGFWIEGNVIGTRANGTSPLPNTGDGINIAALTTSNSTLLNNIIAFNGGRGINAISGFDCNVLANSIFSNASLGIDVNGDGLTPNDTGDADKRRTFRC